LCPAGSLAWASDPAGLTFFKKKEKEKEREIFIFWHFYFKV
jgi:hypothetical protein